MKTLYVICEGPTEQEFCMDSLKDYLTNVQLHAPLIKHSGGGIVSWSKLKEQIVHLLNESDSYVTTFIDYYGIRGSLNYPKWEEGKSIADKVKRMNFLETAMKDEISNNVNYRFFPHLQLHEFESLLFCDVDVFSRYYENANIDSLHKIVRAFNYQPETINNSAATAPSKRILDAVPSYEKVLDGNYLAMEIGLDKMLSLCPHFRDWIGSLRAI